MASIAELKNILDDFIISGGNIDNLSTKDIIYQNIKNKDIKKQDGSYMSMEEKFIAAGYPRKPKVSSNVKGDLVKQLLQYVNDGGDFSGNVKSWPFYEKLNTYIKKVRREYNEKDYSIEMALKDLGFSYNPMYNRFKKLKELKNYRDENGYVDAYRADKELSNYVKDCGVTLDMPTSYVVELIADEKLQKYIFPGDYFSNLNKKITEYLTKNSDFKNLIVKDKNLYNQIRHVKRSALSSSGEQLSDFEVLNLLNIEPSLYASFIDNFQLQEKDNVEKVDKAISNAIEIAKKRNPFYKENKERVVLHYNDFSSHDYKIVSRHAARLGLYLKDYLYNRGICYMGRNVDRFSQITNDTLPNIKEMKQERDKIYSKVFSDNLSKQEQFEAWISASILAYNKYKMNNYQSEPEV